MALTCRQCGVIGSVVDTICRSCGTVLTNGSMPVIKHPGSISSYNNNPPQGQTPQWNNQNSQYNPPSNNQNWQNQQNNNYQNNNYPSNYQNNNYQNSNYPSNNYQNNNLPSWQGYQNNAPTAWNNTNQAPYQQNPNSQPQPYQQPYEQPYQQPYQAQAPQMQMQRWSNQPQWGNGQSQQVFIVNGVHPAAIYQERKSPGLSVLLSFLLTGAGQLYNGQPVKGILMLSSCVILWGFFLGWVVSLWSIYDAYITAKRINSGQQVS